MSNPTCSKNRTTDSGRARRAGRLAAVAGLLLAVTAHAAPPLRTVEECLETGTDLVALPGAAGGTLSARACRGCQTLSLKFDARTRYFIGKEPVPYARLREAASRRTQQLYVFYQPGSRILTRLRLDAGAPTQ
jgi:hypothetical protein